MGLHMSIRSMLNLFTGVSVCFALAAGETAPGSGRAPAGAVVRVVDAGTPSAEIEGPVSFSPDGRFMGVKGADATLRILNTSTGVAGIKVDAFRSGAFAPGGRTFLASTYGDPYGLHRPAVSLWDLKRLVRLMDFSVRGKDAERFVSAAYSPGGDFVAMVEADRSIRLWETSHGNQVFKISRLYHSEVPALFSPDGRHLATVGERSRLRLWDMETGADRFDVSGFKKGMFSPDGRTLLVQRGDGRLTMLEASTGRLLFNVSMSQLMLESFEFSPDGGTLVTRSRDRTLRVWDTATGIQLYKVPDVLGKELEIRIDGAREGWWVPASGKLVWDLASSGS